MQTDTKWQKHFYEVQINPYKTSQITNVCWWNLINPSPGLAAPISMRTWPYISYISGQPHFIRHNLVKETTSLLEDGLVNHFKDITSPSVWLHGDHILLRALYRRPLYIISQSDWRILRTLVERATKHVSGHQKRLKLIRRAFSCPLNSSQQLYQWLWLLYSLIFILVIIYM